MPNPQTIAFIFARGGSKGLPGKNILELGGKPLIAHSIEAGFMTPGIDRVIVSTDDQGIAEVAARFGAEVPFLRPPELSDDKAPEWLAWRHAIEFVNSNTPDTPIGTFISLPCTSPLRSTVDVQACIERYRHGDVDVVITVREAERSPYFNMVRMTGDNLAELAVKSDDRPFRRQDVPELFDITTVAYVCNPSFVLTEDSIFHGRVGAVVVPRERAIDIDTQLDFDIADCLLSHAKPASTGNKT